MPVAITYRARDEEAAAVVKEIEREGGKAIALQANLSTLTDLSGLFDTVEREPGPRRITVNAVAPGPTDTEMVPPARREEVPKLTPLGRLGNPEDLADVIAFLASEQSRWVNGQIVNVNGGLA